MSIKLSDSIRVGQQKPLEDKYFNELVPYTSISQVNTLLTKAVRHIGLTVNINKEEYWYKDGIEDSNLVLKITNNDTSNLVPYTGANKDVNIASNYFETSQGFKKTGGTANQYLMADGSTSTLPTDLIKGTGTIGRIPKFTASGIIGNSKIFDDGTNVGVGTVVPSQKLTVLGADNTIPALGSNGGKLGLLNGVNGVGTYGLIQGVLGNGSSYFQVQRVDGGAIAYNLLLQPNGGNVGIGTTSPSEKLDVNGNVKATGFKTPTGTATQALTANGGTFESNASSQISISGPEGKTIILSEIEKPTKEGYIFDGWEGLSSVKIQAGTDTLFATWTPISES